MPDETMEVPGSPDSGNVPAEAPNPEPTPEATPVEVDKGTTPEKPEEVLYDLPDGRKVDAATVLQEYKNLLPDYTKKSQELAKVKETLLPKDDKPKDPYADREYAPQSYREIIEAAKKEIREETQAEKQQRQQAEKELETKVSGEIAEIKNGYELNGTKIPGDSTLNENALFQHAVKYGFQNLKLAHQNMRDMADVIKKAQKTTVDNINKRNDPVSTAPGAGGGKPDPASFSSATEYLRAIKGS